MSTFDTAIIGAGPAGIATAIQLSRFGLKTVIFEKQEIGGLLRNANLVENYPGFPSGISGLRLADLMEKHLLNSKLDIRFAEAANVDYNSDFVIETDLGICKSKTLVIASGTNPEDIDISGLSEARERTVFTEVYPIADCQDKFIGIIGAGDASFDYALNLSKKNRVTINNRTDKRVCLPLLWNRAQCVGNIEYRDFCSLVSAKSDENRIQLNWNRAGREFSEIVDYLLLAIGRKPNLDFIGKNLHSKISGLEEMGLLHFVGDVKNGSFRQASIAAGQGVYAAMALHQKLNRKG